MEIVVPQLSCQEQTILAILVMLINQFKLKIEYENEELIEFENFYLNLFFLQSVLALIRLNSLFHVNGLLIIQKLTLFY